MSRMPAIGPRDFSTVVEIRSLGEAGRPAKGEDADDHGREQRDQRGADHIEDALHRVLGIVDDDVHQCLGQHQHDRQQHGGDGDAEAGTLLQVVGGALRNHLFGGGHVNPAGRVLREHRARDDHGRYGDEQAEGGEVLTGRTHHQVMFWDPDPAAVTLHVKLAEAVRERDAARAEELTREIAAGALQELDILAP